MAYSYNLYGWFDGEVPVGTPRSTPRAPPNKSLTTTPGEFRSNWTGEGWFSHPYSAPPPPPPPDPVARHISPLAFRNRFTSAEKIAIEMAALDVPQGPMPARHQAASLRASLRDVQAASFIDLEKADIRSRVQALEAAGVIGLGRALVILDTAAAAIELP